MEKKRYSYNGYSLLLIREDGVIYYTISKEGDYVSNGFMPTDESLDSYAKELMSNLPEEEVVYG